MVTQENTVMKKLQQMQEQMQQFTVGIAGIGGLGSNAAVALARASIGKLVLVDFDVVDETNLNRQYYFCDQLGEPIGSTLWAFLLPLPFLCQIPTVYTLVGGVFILFGIYLTSRNKK